MDLLFIYSGEFGEKVIGNLINYDRFCTVCDPACSSCRFGKFNWSPDIRQVLIAPGPEAQGIDDGVSLGPCEPDAEVAFLIDVHPNVLLEFCESLAGSRVRGVVLPVERPGMGPGLIRQARSILEGLGIELAAPKPFCSLEPAPGVVGRVVARYGIGRPLVEVELATTGTGELTVSKSRVIRSSPCGATWYICRSLIGSPAEPEEVARRVSKSHHAYPCTASMSVDRELGDTYLHVAGCVARETTMEAVARALEVEGMQPEADAMRERMRFDPKEGSAGSA